VNRHMLLLILGSWVVGGWIGWNVGQLFFDQDWLKTLAGLGMAWLGIMVGQGIVYHFAGEK